MDPMIRRTPRMTPSNPDARESEQRRGTATNLAAISTANRADVARLVQLRENEGLSPGANYNFTLAAKKADEFLEGKPFREAKADDLMGVVRHIQNRANPQTGRTVSKRTAHLHVMLFRHLLKELLDVDQLPQELNRATRMKKPELLVVGQVLDRDRHFTPLLEYAATMQPPSSTLPHGVRAVALLWTLWDSGVRAGELLSLNVGDLEFQPDGGLWLNLTKPRRGNKLKTGPRRVWLTECTGALRVWLEVHPAGTNSEAPLFNGVRNRDGLTGMAYKDLNDFLHEIGDKSGVNAMLPSNEAFTAHDFRHSSATRRAHQGEEYLRKFHGWKWNSPMPGWYCHMNDEMMRERARRDAGVDRLGLPALQPGAMTPEQMMATAMQAMMAKLHQAGPKV